MGSVASWIALSIGIVVGLYLAHRYRTRCPNCGSWQQRSLEYDTVSHRGVGGVLIAPGGYGQQIWCRKCDTLLSDRQWSVAD